MLTVDYDLLGAERGDLVLDMGCGAGRHAFETVRRGCRIVALDQDLQELVDVRNTFAAMISAGELDADVECQPVSAAADYNSIILGLGIWVSPRPCPALIASKCLPDEIPSRVFHRPWP